MVFKTGNRHLLLVTVTLICQMQATVNRQTLPCCIFGFVLMSAIMVGKITCIEHLFEVETLIKIGVV